MHFTKVFAALSLFGTVALGQTKVKVMPLGDSITEITCWRASLWDNLVNAGLASQVDFVGSMSNNPENCRAATGSFDLNHEGHSGWLAIDIANNYLQGWLASYKPDIVMFMLGTNDVFQGRGTNDIMNAYTKMVQLMRASNPNMKIIVDLVIPATFSNNGLQAINAQIPNWARNLNSTASPIYIADTATGYTTGMLRDGVHPNAQGDALITQRLTPVLLPLIRASLGGGQTPTQPPTTTSPPTQTSQPTQTPTPTAVQPTPGTVAKWGQCGGNGYNGPTGCVSGSTCQKINDWYSQCI
ncbi:SGNH hydrolase [Ascobolus immersus RN42]|uniref:SGNH hydrolase n=1 Tax=Ascobolus immersus RN42 TaxID=1160509 RepID=A0A3N4IER8_ASCIM|nr:SGNH hydrolase [Ascobolus immersus RN42]